LTAADEATLPLAAHLIAEADALVICTGAGMGVSSGLATFRGQAAGVWPPLIGTSLQFEDMSCPEWFERPLSLDSTDGKTSAGFGYAFWQYRYQQYTQTPPHEGYHILHRWMKGKEGGGYSLTSNIDGAWRRIGLPEDQLHEVHGSLDFMQCVANCTKGASNIWKSTDREWNMDVDPETDAIKRDQTLPTCPNCNGRARVNVLMFSDGTFDARREEAQEKAFDDWLKRIERVNQTVPIKVMVIEIGAGTAIPTVRRMSERIIKTLGLERSSLLRINPEHPNIPGSIVAATARDIGNRLISMTSDSLTILQRLDALLSSSSLSNPYSENASSASLTQESTSVGASASANAESATATELPSVSPFKYVLRVDVSTREYGPSEYALIASFSNKEIALETANALAHHWWRGEQEPDKYTEANVVQVPHFAHCNPDDNRYQYDEVIVWDMQEWMQTRKIQPTA